MEFLELLEQIQRQLPPEAAQAAQIIELIFPWLLLAVTLLTCFAGHKIHRLWTIFLFFCVGFLAGAFSGILFPAVDVSVFIGVGVVLGVLAAWFSKRLYRAQLFLMNAVLAYIGLSGILEHFLSEGAAILLGLLGGIIAGALAAKYKFLVTIVTTAVGGAVDGAPMLLRLAGREGELLWLWTLTALLALGGLTCQYFLEKKEIEEAFTSRRTKRAEKAEQKAEKEG